MSLKTSVDSLEWTAEDGLQSVTGVGNLLPEFETQEGLPALEFELRVDGGYTLLLKRPGDPEEWQLVGDATDSRLVE